MAEARATEEAVVERRPATAKTLTRLACAALALLTVTFVITWSLADDASSWDVPLYQAYGSRIVDGAIPYRDVRIEYPPGALVVFVLPALVAGTDRTPVYEPVRNEAADAYAFAFALQMALLLAATIVLTALSLRALGASTRHAAAALGLIGTAPLLLGEIALTRFDALAAALTAAFVAAALRDRPRLAGLALGLAVTAKLYPVLLLPLLAVYVWRRRGSREAVVATACAFGAVLVVALPFVAVAPGEMRWSTQAQLTRGLHVESTPGAIAVALGQIADKLERAGIPVPVIDVGIDEGGTGDVRSADVTGTAGAWLSAVFALLAIGVVVATWVVATRTPATPNALVRHATVVVVAQLAFGRVLSPQFLVWLLPLVPLVAGRRGRTATALLAVALVATHVWFPDLYREYVNDRTALPIAFLLARNALVVALLAVLVLPRRAGQGLLVRTRSPSTPPAASSTNAGASGTV